MLRTILSEDLAPYQKAVPNKSFSHYLRIFPGFRFTFWLRLQDFFSSRGLFWKFAKSLSAWQLRRLSLLTGIQINPGTQIGPGLYMPHHGTIVINPGAHIGRNCYLSHNVTIGKVHTGEKMGVPVIEDDVFIGVGAIILGKITVGCGSAIAPNSVVLDDVPPGVFVGGVPAKVINKKGKRDILGQIEDTHD